MQSSDNAVSTVLYLQEWGPLIFRALLFTTPLKFPAVHDLLPIFVEETSSPITSSPALSSDAAQLAVDDAFSSGETALCLIAKAALHVHNGWRSYQRLLALQPLLRLSASDTCTVAEPAQVRARDHDTSEWSVPPSALQGRAYRGRRIIALALASALREASESRRTKHTLSNLLALTVLLDREFTATWPSGSHGTRRVGAATPLLSGVRSRGSASILPLAILSRGKDAVFRSMSSQLQVRRPPSTAADAGGSARTESASPINPSPVPVELGVDDDGSNKTGTSSSARVYPPIASPSFDSADPVTTELDPAICFDGSLARLVLVAWDDILVPSPDEAERVLAMTCESLPTAGSLLHILVNLSLWTLRAYPTDHPAVLAALARMQRLQLVMFSDLRMISTTPAVDSSTPAGSFANSAWTSTPLPDVKPARVAVGKPPLGRDTISASVPTRIASFLQGSRDRSASVTSSIGGDDEWEELQQLGRPGISLDTWLCFILSQIHSIFQLLRHRVAAASQSAVPGNLESLTAVAELSIALLKDLVQVRFSVLLKF